MSAIKAFEFVAAFDAPCHKCGDNVTVSQAALEACKASNHIAKAKGWKLTTKGEIAICRSCYDTHHELMWAKEMAVSEKWAEVWANFRAAYRAAPDNRRGMLEQKLRLGMGDYWPSYAGLFTAWKAELSTSRARGNTGGSGKAGF